MLCVKIAVGSESESECCRSCCYRSHSAPCSFCSCCCCCFNIFFLAPLLLLVLSMFVVVFLWSNICADSDRVCWGVPPCDKSPKVVPYGRGEGIMKMFCGQFVAIAIGNRKCTQKFIRVRRTNMYLCMNVACRTTIMSNYSGLLLI